MRKSSKSVCYDSLFLDLDFESEATVVKTDPNDSVTNQDGWLNALSLEKLTTTVKNKWNEK